MSAAAPITLLRLRAAARMLDAEWADGGTVSLSYRTLREHCPCAACRQRHRSGVAFEVSDQIDVVAIVPCGPNAVQLRFSDGHERGIFPFPYLRELRDAIRGSAGIPRY